LFHRAAAAFLAISERSALVSDFALAAPPALPPFRLIAFFRAADNFAARAFPPADAMDSMCSWSVIDSADTFFFRPTVGA
jgi:hypothetical protein